MHAKHAPVHGSLLKRSTEEFPDSREVYLGKMGYKSVNTMKRIVNGIVLLLVLAIVMCGCEKSTKTQELSENIEAYEKIAEIALKDFQDEEHKCESDDGTLYVIMLYEFSKYENIKDVIDIAEKEFSYLWIEDGNVVYWNGETKVLGLVYSSNPKNYIKSLEEWYKGMDSEKINENWYVVGQWKSH